MERDLEHLQKVQLLFNKQVSPLRRAMLSLARTLTNRDEDAAEDIVQITLIRCYESFDKFEQGSNLKAWLFFCMRGNWYNYRNERTKKIFKSAARIDKADEDGQQPLLNSLSLSTLGAFKEEYFSDEILAAVQSIPQQFRAIFILSCIEEIPDYEIAEILDIPDGTVKSGKYRARNILTKRLEGFAEEHGYKQPTGRRKNVRRREENRGSEQISKKKALAVVRVSALTQ